MYDVLDIGIEVLLSVPDIQIGVIPAIPDIAMEIDTSGENQPAYQGEYIVVSDIHNTISLETKGKALRENIVVQPIPFYEVGNPQGGRTITIGN